jgi:hypothetical protein
LAVGPEARTEAGTSKRELRGVENAVSAATIFPSDWNANAYAASVLANGGTAKSVVTYASDEKSRSALRAATASTAASSQCWVAQPLTAQGFAASGLSHVAVAKLTDKDRRSEFARLLSFRLGTRGIAEQLSPLKTGFCSRIPSLTEYDHETGTNPAERRHTAAIVSRFPHIATPGVRPLTHH